jgi:hypothetical protein
MSGENRRKGCREKTEGRDVGEVGENREKDVGEAGENREGMSGRRERTERRDGREQREGMLGRWERTERRDVGEAGEKGHRGRREKGIGEKDGRGREWGEGTCGRGREETGHRCERREADR